MMMMMVTIVYNDEDITLNISKFLQTTGTIGLN